jgi:hypothetical protein
MKKKDAGGGRLKAQSERSWRRILIGKDGKIGRQRCLNAEGGVRKVEETS